MQKPMEAVTNLDVLKYSFEEEVPEL